MPVEACKPLYIGWGAGEEEGKEAADLCVKVPALPELGCEPAAEA